MKLQELIDEIINTTTELERNQLDVLVQVFPSDVMHNAEADGEVFLQPHDTGFMVLRPSSAYVIRTEL